MTNEIIKINAKEFEQLVNEVKMIKNFLFNNMTVCDSEGELSDWAKKELEKARNIPDSENISLNEMEQRILAK